MQHEKYINIVKALIHCHNTVDSFYSEISVYHDSYGGLIKINLFKDLYETYVEVCEDSGLDTRKDIMRIKIANNYLIHGKEYEDTLLEDSWCNTAGWGSEKHRMNLIQLNPEVVNLYIRTTDKNLIHIDSIEEEHFQLSTISDVDPIEQYYYMRDMYNLYSDFLPRGYGLVQRYSTYEQYCNDEFRDFITKKVWGLIALA